MARRARGTTLQPRPPQTVAAATVCVLVAGIGFAAMPVIGKAGYDAGLGLGEMLPVRVALAGVMLVAVSVAIGRSWTVRSLVAGPVPLLGLLFGLQASCFYISLDHLPASVTGLLFYSYPALVALASRVLFGGALTTGMLLGLAASAAGIVLVIGGGRVELGVGLAFGLAAPVLYGAYLMTVEWLARDRPPAQLSAATLLTAIPWLVVVVYLAGDAPRLPVSFEGWWLIGLLAVSPAVGFPLLTIGLARLGATAAAIISTCEPVFILVLAAIFLGDVPSGLQWAGAGLIVSAVALAAVGAPEREVEPPGLPGP